MIYVFVFIYFVLGFFMTFLSIMPNSNVQIFIALLVLPVWPLLILLALAVLFIEEMKNLRIKDE